MRGQRKANMDKKKMCGQQKPKVSLVIIALNEEKALPQLLQDIRKQSFAHKETEIILIDSMSKDGTREIMNDFAANNDFFDVICKSNPKVILASGWNVALAHLSGDIIIRVDAHTSLPVDFVEKNVKYIEQGNFICGGKVKNYMSEKTKWLVTVNMAEDSMFGGSVAAFRRKDKAGFVDTLAFAAYKKEVFDKVGGFNEKLVRTEDNEMHYRMRQAGYKFYYTPDIVSYRETRPTFRSLLKQKFLNGYWVGMTAKICPKCFSIYHFVPLMFVIGIVVTGLLAFAGNWLLAAIMWLLYGLFNLLMSIMSCIACNERSLYCLLLPILFLLLHVGYGVGTLKGIISKLKD